MFYTAIQGVRERGLDLTGWHRLNERQRWAIEYLLESPHMDIGAFETLCPGVSRRTLQRDLAGLEEKGLIRHEGETNRLIYRLAGHGDRLPP